MAFTSGAAATPSVLLDALNTFLLANGWTKLRGYVDLAVASPKAARYWRVVIHETVTTNTSTWHLRRLNFRTTVGGANVATVAGNWTIDDLSTGTASDLIAGTANVTRTTVGSNKAWKIVYDFGSPTIVREVLMQATTNTGSCPRAFVVQWSNDRETWTTMWESTGLSWTSSETKLFAFPDTFRYSQHPADNQPSRAGSAEDYALDVNYEASPFREFSEEYFIWQGPGYDASRRVYVHARGHRNPSNLTSHLELSYSIGYDSAIRQFGLQAGQPSSSVFHMFGSGSQNYWFYANNLRIVIITQNGASDYTSSYVGFLEAFALPDYYPFPLCAIASSPNRNQFVATNDNGLSSIHDPGFGSLVVKKWDGFDYVGGNRSFGATEETVINGNNTSPTMWPLFNGASSNNQTWPFNKGAGSTNNGNRRLFDFLSPTQQNDLPMIPCIVMDKQHGHIGVLSDVFGIPGGGILAAQQAIVIGADTYRVFPNRTRRAGTSWFAVKEA